jgi:hypothetical protein
LTPLPLIGLLGNSVFFSFGFGFGFGLFGVVARNVKRYAGSRLAARL